jgi:hypothetical protein
MNTQWILTTSIAFGVLFVAGVIMCLAGTSLYCQMVDIVESLKQAAYFALWPALVSILAHFVPAIVRPFENVLRDTFGVSPTMAPVLGMGYVMMLVAWITGAQAIGSIQKTVCIPTVDEVAAFKTYFQNKAASKDADESKRAVNPKSETSPQTA